MRSRTASWMAWSVCAVTLLVLATSMLLIVLGWSTPLPGGWTSWRDQTVSLLGIIGAPILGGLIASRLPRNPYGWLWLGFGLGLAAQSLAMSYEAYALVVEPGSLAAPRTISHVLELGGQVALTLAPLLMLLFPTGRLPSRRWRPLAWTSTAAGALLLFLVLLFDNPDQVGGVISITTIAVVYVIFTAILLSALSIVVRYRRAGGAERQQLKWFALAAVLIGAVTAGHLLFLDALLSEALVNMLDAVTITFLYVAVGIAILRYRLYDIDIIINRTLVYGSLTVTLVLVYFGSVVGLQYFLRALTGQESQLAIVASTLVIAALFNPLRQRIQNFIDHSFYRRKYDAAKTLEAFSAKLRDETDLDNVSAEMVSVVQETMQPEHVSLWLRKPGRKVERL
jgi:membrane protein CcdC involved in cytochrome C biogenesis